MKFEIDMDDAFMSTFCDAGAVEAYCNCGRTHMAMLSYGDMTVDQSVKKIYDDLEIEAEKNNMLVLHYDHDCMDIITLADKVFVAGCECEGWKPYMNFIIDQRLEIAEFLIKTSKEIKRIQAYEKVMGILSDEYNLPDRWKLST